jgi:ubiquinone/menaquinone biosynthesis C-methylase UbiE
MTTDYNPIAEHYRLAKQQLWRNYIESFTLMNLIGDPTGKAVVDLACGEGFYSRLLKQRGASSVTGVDLSKGMIELARAQEAGNPLGIDYIVADGRSLKFGREFDLAVAAYFLNYARDRDELLAMCEGISRNLTPGGRFVTVSVNPALDFAAAPSYRKYGFELSVAEELREGTPIKLTFFLENSSFEIENYFLSVPIQESVLRAAGFREIRWLPPGLSDEGKSALGEEFWQSFLGLPADHFPRVLPLGGLTR